MRVLVALGILAAGAQAQVGAESVMLDPERLMLNLGRSAGVGLPGSLRVVGGRSDGFAVSSEDAEVGEETPADDFGLARLRVQPAMLLTNTPFKLVRLALDAEFDLPITGTGTPEGLEEEQRLQTRETEFRLSQAYVLLGFGVGAFKVGLARSGFGMGLVANPGEDAPFGSVEQSPFGFARAADRVARLQLALFPMAPRVVGDGTSAQPLTLAATTDIIIDDDRATWADGDRAFQFSGAALLHLGDVRAGLGVVSRFQEHEEGGETDLTIFIANARVDLLYTPVSLWAEAEAVIATGSSTLSQSSIHTGAFDVLATGGAGRLGTAWKALEGVVEVGVASGDDNPFDDELHDFTFDREYRVGLLMFGEAARVSSAVAAHNVADETFRARAPRGYDALATNGAVRNAIYVNPRVAWSPRFLGLEGLSILAGYLWGRTAVPWTDAFNSSLVGGASVGPRGAEEVTGLGHEIDLGVDYRRRVANLSFGARAQGAYFAPGEVFDDETGASADPILGFLGTLEVKW